MKYAFYLPIAIFCKKAGLLRQILIKKIRKTTLDKNWVVI